MKATLPILLPLPDGIDPATVHVTYIELDPENAPGVFTPHPVPKLVRQNGFDFGAIPERPKLVRQYAC